jgi:hypothetical protein
VTTCKVVENALVSESAEVVAVASRAGEGVKVDSGARVGSAILAFGITSCVARVAISTVGIIVVGSSDAPQADTRRRSTNREMGNARGKDSALLTTSTLFPLIP